MDKIVGYSKEMVNSIETGHALPVVDTNMRRTSL